MPILHEHGKHIIALLFKQQSGHTGIYSSGQTDTYLHNLRFYYWKGKYSQIEEILLNLKRLHKIIDMNKKIEINYQEFQSLAELEAQDRELCEAAAKALAGSYAPYSNFNVGAAVRLDDGSIVTGANQENSAYPSGLCAERTAMFAAHSNHPDVPMRSIAIVGAQNGLINKEITAPCGACRQVMAEYQKLSGGKMSVIFYGDEKILKFSQVDDILPFIFTNLD